MQEIIETDPLTHVPRTPEQLALEDAHVAENPQDHLNPVPPGMTQEEYDAQQAIINALKNQNN